MTFKTAGDDDRFKPAGGDPQNSALPDSAGLPLRWKNLREGGCPKCGDELIEFKHIRMMKCTCGFKISEHRMSEILNKMDDDDDFHGQGFGFSNYHDDPPF